MRKFFVFFIFFFLSCTQAYIRKTKLLHQEFEKILLKKYGESIPDYIYIKGDFESYGKTYLKGFFIFKLKNDSAKIKIVSPPFFIKEVSDYFVSFFKYYFNPFPFLKRQKIIEIFEKDKFYIVETKGADIYFDKENCRILRIYFEGGTISFGDFHGIFPAFAEIILFDEQMRLRVNEIEVRYEGSPD